jgi:hypothetical protein
MRSFRPSCVVSLALLAFACGGSNDATQQPEKSETCTAREALTVERPAARLLLTAAALERLQERARGEDPAWVELRMRCDDYATGTMYPPGGTAYPSYPSVGVGYQGDEYVEPMISLGLCYRTAAGIDDAAAARYAEAGVRLIEAISTPESAGGFRVSTNSGYGIRHFGTAMAFGYDWLHPVLTDATKSRVVASLNAFIDWYDSSGFVRNDPIANYFVGYFRAKTLAALATQGDNPKADGYWQDVADHLWAERVKPEYSTLLDGGSWPEGWGYGRLAVGGMIETLVAVKTAKNLDWLGEVSFAADTGRYLAHFAWPSLGRMDDYGTIRAGTPIVPSVALVTSVATALEGLGDDYSAQLRSFGDDVLASTGDDRHPWERFFYSDPDDARADYRKEPASHVAPGPDHVAARSDWNEDAVWMSLNAGAYVNATDSGEQLFNSGEVAFVRGGDPVLVRATGWLPHVGGTAGENAVYQDSFGTRRRELYNTFFVEEAALSSYGPGQFLVTPAASTAGVESVEDSGAWLRARAVSLEDQYARPDGVRPVTQFTRDVVYVRPGTLVLYDRTTVRQADADQWMSLHVPSAPNPVGSGSYHVSSGTTTGGIHVLLPAQAALDVVALPGDVHRIEAHATNGSAEQRWLAVATAGASAPSVTRLSAEDGNVLAGSVTGVLVAEERGQVVIFPTAHEPGSTVDRFEYRVTGSDATHLMVDLAPASDGYSVVASPTAEGLVVSVSPGGPLTATAGGVLQVEIDRDGNVALPAAPPVPPNPDPMGIEEESAPATPSADGDPAPEAAGEVVSDPGAPTTSPSAGEAAPSDEPGWWRTLETVDVVTGERCEPKRQ